MAGKRREKEKGRKREKRQRKIKKEKGKEQTRKEREKKSKREGEGRERERGGVTMNSDIAQCTSTTCENIFARSVSYHSTYNSIPSTHFHDLQLISHYSSCKIEEEKLLLVQVYILIDKRERTIGRAGLP